MDRYLVIGLGVFGRRTAIGLMENGAEVLAVDHDEDRTRRILEQVTEAVTINATDPNALRDIAAQQFDCAIVTISDLAASLLCVIHLRRAGVPRLVARASNEIHAELLRLSGADETLEPERDAADRLVNRLTAAHVLSHIMLAEDHVMVELCATGAVLGKSLKDLNLRARYRVNIIALKHLSQTIGENGENRFIETIDDVPAPDAVLREGDVLMVVGKTHQVELVKKEFEG